MLLRRSAECCRELLELFRYFQLVIDENLPFIAGTEKGIVTRNKITAKTQSAWTNPIRERIRQPPSRVTQREMSCVDLGAFLLIAVRYQQFTSPHAENALDCSSQRPGGSHRTWIRESMLAQILKIGVSDGKISRNRTGVRQSDMYPQHAQGELAGNLKEKQADSNDTFSSITCASIQAEHEHANEREKILGS
ncbi:MAG: hypothetical protein WBG04_03220 [Haloferula sp.]